MLARSISIDNVASWESYGQLTKTAGEVPSAGGSYRSCEERPAGSGRSNCKSPAAQEVRAVLTARKSVQSKLYDVEISLQGILRGFGMQVGPPTTPRSFGRRIKELVAGHPIPGSCCGAPLGAPGART
jgi:hypothetical protein